MFGYSNFNRMIDRYPANESLKVALNQTFIVEEYFIGRFDYMANNSHWKDQDHKYFDAVPVL